MGLAHPQITQLLKGRRRLKVSEVPQIAEYLETVPPAVVLNTFDRPDMSLGRALYILASAHTDDDEQVGFRVHATAASEWFSVSDYIQAWKVVREHIGLPTEPSAK